MTTATPPTFGDMYDLLDQAAVWRNREGETIALAAIDARYAANILRFLMRRARLFANVAHAELLCIAPPSAEMANDAYWDEVGWLAELVYSQESAEGWLGGRSLVQALQAKAAGE